MNRIRAIVFDAGGTLIYPARPVGETYAQFARKWDVTLDSSATTAAFRAAFKSCSPRGEGGVPRDGNDRVWWKQVVGKSMLAENFPDPAAFDAFFEEVYLHYARPEAWAVFPEVGEVLERLSQHNVVLAVLSNWDARLHTVLNGHGMGALLARRFISGELGREKPDPAIYQHVTQSLGLPASSVLSVGDDPMNDVEAPRRAGWQALLVARPDHDLRATIPIYMASSSP